MRFRELILQARDPDSLAAWYGAALGLPPADGTPVGFVAGLTTVRFERAAPDLTPTYHFAFNIPANQVADALRWLRGRAPILESDGEPVVDYRSWDAHAVYFSDPAGNVVELIARHALPNASARPFGAASLLEVSEVGLPCQSVPDLAVELRKAFGIEEYGSSHARFAALGDERGLLILVPEGRPWFPTTAQARPFPLRVVHEGAAHEVSGLPYRFEPA